MTAKDGYFAASLLGSCPRAFSCSASLSSIDQSTSLLKIAIGNPIHTASQRTGFPKCQASNRLSETKVSTIMEALPVAGGHAEQLLQHTLLLQPVLDGTAVDSVPDVGVDS